MEPIGESLTRRREELGITLREAESATRIRLRYLEAMEEGRFDDLPGEVFAKGFLRAYATYLGLDGTRLVEDFKATRPAAETPVAPAAVASASAGRARRRRRRSGRRWTLPFVLAVLAAVGLLMLHARGRQPRSPRRAPPAASATATAAGASHAPAATASPAPQASAPSKPKLVAGTLRGGVMPFTLAGSSTVDVRATFTGPCWVRVWIDGVQQHPDRTLERGQSAVWRGHHSVRILLGNPPQAHLVVDGVAMGPIQAAHPRTVSIALASS